MQQLAAQSRVVDFVGDGAGLHEQIILRGSGVRRGTELYDEEAEASPDLGNPATPSPE
ncbi:MAG: hypothetical protein ABIS92_13085 [Polyangia bacterium]